MSKAVGTCALTGETGQFIKCHLMPRALTRPRPGGEAFPQIGNDQRPVKRRDSWYDNMLVIQAGEDILTSHDTFGIAELRREKLVWQSWGPMVELSTSDFSVFPAEPYGLRLVRFSDPLRLRRFLLSLLWRAAATELVEFGEVQLRSSDLRRLRSAVRDHKDMPTDFFPATLLQLSSRGFDHNMAPLAQTKQGARTKGFKSRDQKMIRFYFDGLVVHFHLDPQPKDIDGMYPCLIGENAATTVVTVRTHASWEWQNLLYSIEDSERFHPGMLNRTGGI